MSKSDPAVVVAVGSVETVARVDRLRASVALARSVGHIAALRATAKHVPPTRAAACVVAFNHFERAACAARGLPLPPIAEGAAREAAALKR